MFLNLLARPDKPNRCKVYNGSRAVEVRCSPGYDGGRTQKFHVEVITRQYNQYITMVINIL